MPIILSEDLLSVHVFLRPALIYRDITAAHPFALPLRASTTKYPRQPRFPELVGDKYILCQMHTRRRLSFIGFPSIKLWDARAS
jgi:hypothetical protein